MNLLIDQKISGNIYKLSHESLDIGDRIADRVANVAGSWKFIISFVTILATRI